MDLLLVTPEYPPYGSGIANAVHKIVNHLSKHGVVTMVVSRKGGDVNISTLFDDLPGIFGLISFWQRAIKYAIEMMNAYDALWLHSPLLLDVKGLYSLSKTKTIIMTFHSTYWGFYNACKENAITHLIPYYFLASKIERLFLKGISLMDKLIVTSVSPAVSQELVENGLSRFKIPYVVPNGLEEEFMINIDKLEARGILRERYGLEFSQDDQLLIYVGRVTEIKQPLLLIEMFEQINVVKPNTHLLIVGSGNLLRKIRRNQEKIKNLHIMGHIPHKDIPIFLRASDAFISLSCYEGLPLSVLEAASLGLPLILSDIHAHRWIVSLIKGRVILLDPHKSDLTRVLTFLNILEKEKSACDLSPIPAKDFSWKNIINLYLSLLGVT